MNEFSIQFKKIICKQYHLQMIYFQVETMSQRDAIKIPIAVLKAGETRCVRTDLEFPDAPVTFTLIEGAGPVYIHGQHLPGTLVEEIEDYGDEMEEELLDEEEAVSRASTEKRPSAKNGRSY